MSKDNKEEDWKYDYDFLYQLTIKIKDLGSDISMEDVENVLTSVNYQPPSEGSGEVGLRWVKASEVEKKIKTDLIWELIVDWQDAREFTDDEDYIKEPRFSFNDIEVELYNKLEEIDPQSKDNKPQKGSEGDGWISIKDGLPTDEGDIILYDGDSIFSGWAEQNDETEVFNDFRKGGTGAVVHGITHWRPLPKPPNS